MIPPSLSWARKTSYVLAVLALYAVSHYGLGHALIAGMFSYMMLDEGQKALRGAGASETTARWAALAIFLVTGLLLAFIFVTFIRLGVERIPLLFDRAIPRLDELTRRFGLDLPDNVQELRVLILTELKQNARAVESASGLLTRGFFQIVTAVVVAILRYLAAPKPRDERRGLDVELVRECRARGERFAASFERVMSAQVMIAAINGLIAAVFLVGFQIPFRTMLTLTAFVCGMIPIAGNLISNTLIVAAALTRSDHLALLALVFLVVVHKGGYFLTGKIVGARTETPTWAILLGLLVGEATMGVTGVILAPTLIHYAREELRAVPEC